ncbi:hypothetical protein Dimus_021025 [Dionaea muscipula]
MAVESTQMNLFPNRETASNLIDTCIAYDGNQIEIGIGRMIPTVPCWPKSMVAAAAAAGTLYESQIPSMVNGPFLTNNDSTTVVQVSRKRSRDSGTVVGMQKSSNRRMAMAGGGSYSSSLAEALSLQIMQQQWEIGSLMASHTEKVKLDMEERRTAQWMRIMAAIEAAVSKELRDKQEEIVKIGKVNYALEEKIKSLCLENQILRELAQTNEATANALKTVLSQAANIADDAESCCGSNGDGCGHEATVEDDDDDEEMIRWRKVARRGSCEDWEMKSKNGSRGYRRESNGNICRMCGMMECSVLLLPCRHLCVCTGCGSTIDACPVCYSAISATVLVNFS